jgi:hypothetical protein
VFSADAFSPPRHSTRIRCSTWVHSESPLFTITIRFLKELTNWKSKISCSNRNIFCQRSVTFFSCETFLVETAKGYIFISYHHFTPARFAKICPHTSNTNVVMITINRFIQNNFDNFVFIRAPEGARTLIFLLVRSELFIQLNYRGKSIFCNRSVLQLSSYPSQAIHRSKTVITPNQITTPKATNILVLLFTFL